MLLVRPTMIYKSLSTAEFHFAAASVVPTAISSAARRRTVSFFIGQASPLVLLNLSVPPIFIFGWLSSAASFRQI